MYQPGRPRPRLTSITRTRSGCMTCRRRKKRCDETVPRCLACTRLGLDCVRPGRTVKFSSERSIVGPSPSTRQSGWSHGRHGDAPSPSSAKHPYPPRSSNELRTPGAEPTLPRADISPIDSRSPPLLTPEHSNGQSISSPCYGDGVQPTSPSTLQHIESFVDWENFDYSLLLEIDWTLPPLLDLEEGSTPDDPDSLHDDRDTSIDEPRQPRQPWFTALPAESESNSNVPKHTSNPQQSDLKMLLESRKMYQNHWDHIVVNILPPVFRRLSSYVDRCEALSSGILALSAAHLSHIHVQVRTKYGTEGEFYTGPNHGHMVYMRQYYDAALRQLSSFIADDSSNPVLTLGSFLVLMHVESTVGSFRGEAFHESGIERLLSDKFAALSQDSLGSGLIRAWLVARAVNWSHRIPFTVLSYGKALRDMGIDFISYLSQDAILPIMLESYYHNAMILFERFVGRGDMESISSRCYRFYHSLVEESRATLPWRPIERPPDDDYRAELLRLSSALKDWHSGLTLEDLPIELFGSHRMSRSKFCSASSDPGLSTLSPLQFRTHRAAMNYAFYFCACLLQSQPLLSYWEQGVIQTPTNTHEPDYLFLLLRTLLGLDPKACFEENIFSIGLSELLLIGLFRCSPTPMCDQPNENAVSTAELFMSFAKSVVVAFESRSIFREGHASLERLRDIIYLNEELRRMSGKSMFFLISGEADTAWTKIYGHGMDKAVILGRDSHTEKMFGEKVHLKFDGGRLEIEDGSIQ